jgi:hypothetical protein
MFWDFEKLVASGFDLEFRFVIFFFKKIVDYFVIDLVVNICLLWGFYFKNSRSLLLLIA